MLFKIIQYGVLSLCLISITHFLIRHLTVNLTAPRVKDLVTTTNEKYDSLIQQLSSSSKTSSSSNGYVQSIPNTSQHGQFENNPEKASLKDYLRTGTSLANTSQSDSTYLDYPMTDTSQDIDGPVYASGNSNDEMAYADYD